MIRWLMENVSLMLLALIISFVVWTVAEWESDPIIEGEFDEPIQVQIVNQPADTQLVSGWEQEVSVQLRAPQSVWDQLGQESFAAVLNLSPNSFPLSPGVHSIGVEVSTTLSPAEILQIEPEQIKIELEAIRERLMPIDLEVRGEPDSAYRASEPVIMSDTVKVSGPASLVAQVEQVRSSISLRGARESLEEFVALIPVDAAGRRVNGRVTLEPEQVLVRVLVEPRSNVKEMAVTLDRSGDPAEGYRVTNVRIDPADVTVLGPLSILNELPGFLTTVPISIEGRTENVVETLPLQLPEGVSVLDPKQPAVQVTIEIEAIRDSLTVTRTLTFQGLQPGFVPIASPEVVEVILSGPLPRLSALSPDDVVVILDLSDLRVGEEPRPVEPDVVVKPEEITVDSIIPLRIQVQVVREPTPTPTLTPAPTP